MFAWFYTPFIFHTLQVSCTKINNEKISKHKINKPWKMGLQRKDDQWPVIIWWVWLNCTEGWPHTTIEWPVAHHQQSQVKQHRDRCDQWPGYTRSHMTRVYQSTYDQGTLEHIWSSIMIHSMLGVSTLKYNIDQLILS